MVDARPYLPGATGSGGSGFSLGPIQNEFVDNAARDTYAAANAAWLTEYNGDRSFWIRVGGAAGNIQRRNAAGTAWENVTGIVSGRQGIQGSQGRFPVYCYVNAATAPADPTGGTFNLTTRILTVPTGTTADRVEPTGSALTWRSRAWVDPAGQTGTINLTWSAFTTDVEASLAARAETAETAAEAAQTAAETAQTNAETAETNAETAETGAETAQTRAEAAQSGAETALSSSGAALAFHDLWSGDIDLQTANQWVALGTEAVPSNATWLLWNGGTLTDGSNDGPAALWTWINAADWRALTADTVGTTAGDGTGMLFADWCASDIGDGTPDFTRRDAVIGRTSADIPLIMGPQTGESYFGARLMYITQAVATPGGTGGASSFSELTGMIADGQVPDSFTRDSELAAYALLAGAVFTGAVNGITPTADAHLSRKDYVDTADALKASLAGATFTGVVLLHGTPTADNEAATKAYVDTVAAGMTPTPVSHNRYGALKATNNFVAGDFTGANGFTSDTDTLTVPAFIANRYLAFAIRNDIADPTDIREEGSAFNSIGLFTKQGTQVEISGEMYNVWISNAALLPNSAESWVIS